MNVVPSTLPHRLQFLFSFSAGLHPQDTAPSHFSSFPSLPVPHLNPQSSTPLWLSAEAISEIFIDLESLSFFACPWSGGNLGLAVFFHPLYFWFILKFSPGMSGKLRFPLQHDPWFTSLKLFDAKQVRAMLLGVMLVISFAFWQAIFAIWAPSSEFGSLKW